MSQTMAEFFFIDIEIKDRAKRLKDLNAGWIADGACTHGDHTILGVFKGVDHLGFTPAEGLLAVLFVIKTAIGSNQAVRIDEGKPQMPCQGAPELCFARALKTNEDKVRVCPPISEEIL